MTTSRLDSFLFGNKPAVKMAIKLSVSVWGAFFIAMLMHMERPVWAMITGMISFFSPAHAQVLKKCIYQCLSTLLAGVLGVILMGFLAQSPLFAALAGGVLIFAGAAAAFHTRDSNFTFCCTVFAVTISLMIVVPANFGPTSNFIINTFIDRVGTILCGVVWAAFVSACLWPEFSTDELRGSAGKLFSSVLSLPQNFKVAARLRKTDFAQVYAGIIEHSDIADHCDFEGMWGRRGARVARKMNMLATRICTHVYTLLRSTSSRSLYMISLLRELENIAKSIQSKGDQLQAGDLERLEHFIEERAQQNNKLSAGSADEQLGHARIKTLAQDLHEFVRMYISLLRSEKIDVKGVRVRRYPQWKNCIRTGLRAMILFLLTYTIWYATGWTHGFLIAVVPIVYSVALCKAPHPAAIVRQIIIGTLIAIPVGLVVTSILGQAPSAIELMVLTAGVVMFFGFMGMSSMHTFAYSMGFNISFLVILLPQNYLLIDMPFAIERSLAIAIGTAILAGLFILIPKRPALKDPSNPSALFNADLQRFLLTDKLDRSSPVQLVRSIGLVIDKMVHVATQEAPEQKKALLEHAGKSMFLMSQSQQVSQYIHNQGLDAGAKDGLAAWHAELYDNYVSGQDRWDHALVDELRPVIEESLADQHPAAEGQCYAYLNSLDQTTRSIFR